MTAPANRGWALSDTLEELRTIAGLLEVASFAAAHVQQDGIACVLLEARDRLHQAEHEIRLLTVPQKSEPAEVTS